MILKLLMLGIWMVVVPLGTGYFALEVSRTGKIKRGTDGGTAAGMGYALCHGYILMWALFQLIAVPLIIKAGRFRQVELIFEAVCLTFSFAGFFLLLLHLKHSNGKTVFSQGRTAFSQGRNMIFRGREIRRERRREKSVLPLLLWAVFLAGVLFQMLQAYRLAYADGDDAFYIPVSVAASQGGIMYTDSPYTGDSTDLNLRYGLAPFPIWVAFIAAKCKVNAAVAAHSLMPLVLIPLTYLLYLEIGKRLCAGLRADKENRGMAGEGILPLFMIFVMLLQIFGNYSIYPASTFLLTRTRQGKAALGNVVLPFFILLLYRMAEEIKEQGKAGKGCVLWLAAAMTAGCLCSTMAGFLCGMFVMLTVFLLFLLYRKPSVLWQGLFGCIPGIVYALLYLKF